MGIVFGCLCHYTQCTDDAIRKGLVSKDKVELLKQIQGLQTQKTDLLTTVMVLLTGSGVRRDVADLQSKTQAVKNKSENESHTEDFTVLHNNYTIIKEYADKEHAGYLKVYNAYELVSDTCDLMFQTTQEL
jgi:hypothetical protein